MENAIKKLGVNQEYAMILLKYFDDFCKRYNIKYSLDCGSLIGAVREKGFIEWDDDIDIALTRPEYEKFLKAIDVEVFPDDINIYRPEKCKQFLDFTYKIYYKKARVREDFESLNNYDGIYSYQTLDIFVYDNLPENKFLNRFYILLQQISFGLAMSGRHKVSYKKYKIIEKFSIFILRISGSIFKVESLCKFHNDCSKLFSKKRCKYLYGTSFAPEYPGYVYPNDAFDEVEFVPFEDMNVPITKKYDEVLKIGYGEYMIPEKTHTHDGFIENL